MMKNSYKNGHQARNPEAVGSNPTPATNHKHEAHGDNPGLFLFYFEPERLFGQNNRILYIMM